MTFSAHLTRSATRAGALAVAALALASCAPSGGGQSPDASPRPAAGAAPRSAPATAQTESWGIVIHGGAGVITRASLTPEREAEYRAGLETALRAGHAVLARGGSSMDAVEAAIRTMEDNPLFNAGRGAVFTAEGHNELDAAVMDGRTLGAGAVSGLRHVKNPITLARAVMERSPHVMLSGEGAEQFARERGIELVPESYFRTEARWQGLLRAREEEQRARAAGDTLKPQAMYSVPDDRKFGTVGAVALDKAGNLAAGTSTGGMTNKRWGRIGDAPIIGAGTYASNRSCAVSATGHGEFFIRNTVARDICALVEYRGMPLRDAADEVVMRRLVQQGGEGGIIAMDPRGNWTLTFNSPGMYRGHVGADGRIETAIFREGEGR